MRRIVCAGLALVVLCGRALAGDLSGDVASYRAGHEREIVGRLATLAAMRSVAADPQGLGNAASYLQHELAARGFQTQVWTAKAGSPGLVFGSLTVKSATRTAVFYAHYDGQPVTPSQWVGDPFVPVLRSGTLDTKPKDIDWKTAPLPFDPQWRLFGRAAADDKSSIVAFLSAFDAMLASGHPPSVNIKVVWEGEEEAGSPHIAEILHDHAKELAADVWFIGDGPVHQSRQQTLYFGARGSVSVEATVYGPVRALHDGHYGNWVPNPAAMAAGLIASMRDDDGHILIPGFADDVRPLNDAEKNAVAALPPVEDALKQQFGIGRSEGGDGLTASTLRPAINIRGIRSGQVGAEAANAIPVDATISIDFRLVPDQTPAHVREKVEAFLTAKGWTVVHSDPDAATRMAHARIVKLDWEGAGYPGLRSDMASPAAQAAIRAASDAAGKPVAILPMMGGSVPIYLFDQALHVPIIGLPITNHDNNQHAANENLRLQNLWDGIATYAALMTELHW